MRHMSIPFNWLATGTCQRNKQRHFVCHALGVCSYIGFVILFVHNTLPFKLSIKYYIYWSRAGIFEDAYPNLLRLEHVECSGGY